MPDAGDGVQESSEEFEELLRSQNLSEIQEEVENLNFLLLKLREKLHKAQVSGRRAGSQTGRHDGMVAEPRWADRWLRCLCGGCYQLDRMMAESEVRNFRPELLKDVDAMEKRTEKVER